MRYKLVLFDLDGTLLDTLDDLGGAVNHALGLRGFPLHSREEYMKMVGHGIRNLVTQALPEEKSGDEALIDSALADFKSYYTSHIDVNTRPYPGIQELLKWLYGQGVQIAIVSNKFQEGTEYLIHKFFPDISFAALLGNRPGFPLKPDPEIVAEVLAKTGVNKEEAVLVGDSRTDMATAANGGIAGIAVNWGYRPMQGIPGLTVARSAAELPALLGALPYTVPLHSITVQRDTVYSSVKGYWDKAPVGRKGTVLKLLPKLLRKRPLSLKMDIYMPEDDGGARRPLLLMMHGGSFFVGHKEELGQAGWCEYFARLGYVAASIDYRLGFLPTRKDISAAEVRALEDADAAIAYLLKKEDLRIDPDRIFAAGTSAGAILSLRLAFRPSGIHPRILAIGNFWGSVQDLSMLENARTAILSYQSPHDPVMPYGRGYPFRTGTKRIEPPTHWFSGVMYGTASVHEKAVALGLRAEHHACPEPRHRLHIGDDGRYTERFYEIRDRMASFFAEEMAGSPDA